MGFFLYPLLPNKDNTVGNFRVTEYCGRFLEITKKYFKKHPMAKYSHQKQLLWDIIFSDIFVPEAVQRELRAIDLAKLDRAIREARNSDCSDSLFHRQQKAQQLGGNYVYWNAKEGPK